MFQNFKQTITCQHVIATNTTRTKGESFPWKLRRISDGDRKYKITLLFNENLTQWRITKFVTKMFIEGRKTNYYYLIIYFLVTRFDCINLSFKYWGFCSFCGNAIQSRTFIHRRNIHRRCYSKLTWRSFIVSKPSTATLKASGGPKGNYRPQRALDYRVISHF